MIERDYILALTRHGPGGIVNRPRNVVTFIERTDDHDKKETAVYMRDTGLVEFNSIRRWQTSTLAGRHDGRIMNLTMGKSGNSWWEYSPWYDPDINDDT